MVMTSACTFQSRARSSHILLVRISVKRQNSVRVHQDDRYYGQIGILNIAERTMPGC